MKEFLDYTPDGSLVWKPRDASMCKSQRGANVWNARYAGTNAGALCPTGYLRVSIRKRLIYAHQIVWEMHNGPAPKGLVIDHINHNKLDNRIENLRLVTYRSNSQNMALRPTNTSGVCGVCWSKANNCWVAGITVRGKAIYLGSFASLEEAAAARAKANQKYGFHKNHGLAVAA